MTSATSACGVSQLLCPAATGLLQRARLRYPANYDDVFDEVHFRIVSQGAATKSDLAALIHWKRIQTSAWMRKLLLVPATAVRMATAAAFAPGLSDADRLSALRCLPGMKTQGAIASVVLAAWDPSEFAVFDRFALAAKRYVVDAGCSCDWNDLPTYWSHLRRIAGELPDGRACWTARAVDQALYKL